MAAHHIKQFDTRPTVILTISNDDGVVDISTATNVQLYAYDYSGTVWVQEDMTFVTDGEDGQVTVTLDSALVQEPGRYRAVVIITQGDGGTQTFPTFGWFRIIVEPRVQEVV